MGRLHYNCGLDVGIRRLIRHLLGHDQGFGKTTTRHTNRVVTLNEESGLRFHRPLCKIPFCPWLCALLMRLRIQL